MKKRLVLIVATFFIVNITNAQRWKLKRYEAITGVGVTNIFGDVGGTADENNLYGLKDFKIRDSRPSLYLGVRYRLTEEQALKLNIITGFGSGNDEDSKNSQNRSYKFQTILIEPSLQYEYYFLREDRNTKTSAMYSRKGMINTFNMMSAYGFAGIGGVLYSPKIEGESIVPEREYLRNDAGFTTVIPVGIGVKYVLSSEISFNLELGGRLTFTDQLDGLTTDFSKRNDIYYFGTFSVVFKLTTSRRGIPIIFERGIGNRKSKARPSSGRKPVGW